MSRTLDQYCDPEFFPTANLLLTCGNGDYNSLFALERNGDVRWRTKLPGSKSLFDSVQAQPDNTYTVTRWALSSRDDVLVAEALHIGADGRVGVLWHSTWRLPEAAVNAGIFNPASTGAVLAIDHARRLAFELVTSRDTCLINGVLSPGHIDWMSRSANFCHSGTFDDGIAEVDGDVTFAANDAFDHVLTTYTERGAFRWRWSLGDRAPTAFSSADVLGVQGSRLVLAGIGDGSLFGEVASTSKRIYGMFVSQISATSGRGLFLAEIASSIVYEGVPSLASPLAMNLASGHIDVSEWVWNQRWPRTSPMVPIAVSVSSAT